MGSADWAFFRGVGWEWGPILFLGGFVVSRRAFSSGRHVFVGTGERPNRHYETAFLAKAYLELAMLHLRLNGVVVSGRLCSGG